MKQYSFILLIILISGRLEAQVNAQKLIESQLKVIENYVAEIEKAKRTMRVNETVTIKTDPINAAKFLEEQSGIKCDKEQTYDGMYIPSRKNLKDWKAWYRKNKKSMYWDEKLGKVKIRN